MERCFNYVLLRFAPDRVRGECVNIGVAVFKEGDADVRITTQLAKAQALVPNEDLSALWRDLPDAVSDIVRRHDPETAARLLRQFGPISASPMGQILADDETYESRVNELLRWLVTPTARVSSSAGRSRLATEVRAEFKKHKLLATSVDELYQHKVVAGFDLPGDDDLSVDFAIKNGIFRFTQVVDYRTTSKGAHNKIKEVSLKAIAIHQSPRALDVSASEVKGYALVWVPPELADVASPHLKILHDFMPDILHYDTSRDRNRYWELVSGWTKSEGPLI